ncbi:MAG: MOSC domain-containing protein [Pseudomonadota bacterium]
MQNMLGRFNRTGEVLWLGARPARNVAMVCPQALELRPLQGIVGDRYQSRRGNRQVTLVQAEHLQVVASLLQRSDLAPALLRRNVLVEGINLLALLGQEFRLGEATLIATGRCQPCSKMERLLGYGGYNAMRGHGGITANVVQAGVVRVGDTLAMLT